MAQETRAPTTVDPEVRAAPAIADPAALGLAGFAMATFVLSAHAAGWAPDLVWIGLAIFYGGIAQFAAGMWEFRKGNTFGATAFSSYGMFWMSLATFALLVLFGKAPAGTADQALGWFVLGFAIFNTYMTLWALRVNLAVFGVFLALEITEILLTIGYLGKSSLFIQLGGYLGVVTAIVAWYTSAAVVVNSLGSRPVLPVGRPLWRGVAPGTEAARSRPVVS